MSCLRLLKLIAYLKVLDSSRFNYYSNRSICVYNFTLIRYVRLWYVVVNNVKLLHNIKTHMQMLNDRFYITCKYNTIVISN